ncbi:MAG: PAS domain S-box protein, partial [Methanotrichaceae archaeon]|nr:PAS domain S-box protein [Methanotrichaceae archaeon]
MVTVLRRSGIEVVGDVPWGTHFCQFYETGQDLIEVLVPYFHEGLKGNEFCMWITSEPLQVDQAKAALQAAVPDLDRYIEKGQIEILDYDQWYTRSGKFSADEVLRGWIDKLTAALERGYDGLRLTGNTFWLEKANWANFTKYEESVNNVIGRYRMLAICTYSLRKCGAMEILDVLANHQFALVKRSGKWEIVESAHHKKIEQALRRSEEMLRTAIDFTYDWEYWIDPEGKFVFISPSCERITGYSMNEFMTDPKLIEKIVHPDDSEHFSRHFLENDDKAISIDFRIIARNREERWISHICQSVYSSDGRYLGRRASNRDITDHKQTEYALKMTSVKSENERMRLKAVMESLPVGVAILNAQGGNIQSNRWFEEIWGRPRPEVRAVNDYTVFKAWWADTGKLVRPEEWASAKAVQNGETVVGQFVQIERFDGKRAFVLNSAAPIIDANGKIIGSAVAIMDITERIAMEKALRESEERLRLAQFSANVGIWDWNPQTGAVSFTPELDRLYGLAPGTIRTYQDWRERVHPDDILRIEDERDKAIDNHRSFNLDFRIKHGSGEFRWISAKGGAFYNEEGENIRVLGVNIDISKRKKVEEALSQERDFVSTVLDTAKALVVVLDTQGRIIRFNRECEQLTGYSFDEVQGKTFWDLFLLPEDIDIIKSKFNTFQSGDYPRKNENAWLTKDGMPKQIAWSNSVLKDKDDRVTNIIAIGIEITERKHMEEALRETRDYLENLVDHANAPIIVWDSSFRITRFNQAFERLTYLKADEVLGKQLDVLFPDGSKKDSMNLIRGTLTGERWETVEIPILRADKSVRIVLWNSANILGRDGTEVVATIAQGQDITDRKRMETELEQMVKELQETRDYLENLINYANAPIIVWDSSFMITRFNNAFEKLTGFKAAEVLGNHLDILFPSGSKRDSMNLIQSTLAGERWETVEIPILRTDGSERIVLWNSANILSQNGIEVIATIAQGQDITDRKRMETELEQMVLERTVELSAAKEELGMINEALRVEIAEHEKLELDLLKA